MYIFFFQSNVSGILGGIDGIKTLPNGTVVNINPEDRHALYYNYELQCKSLGGQTMPSTVRPC